MRSFVRRLALVLIAMVGFGCSSKSSDHADAGRVSEAGVIDSGKSSADVRRTDTLVSEAGALRDAKLADVARRDVPGIDGAADANRDTSTTVKRDVALRRDAADDVPDPPPPSGTCTNPIQISASLTHGDFVVDTTGFDHAVDFPCASNGSDIVFIVQTNERELVYADTFGSGVNTALFFSETCSDAQPPVGDGMITCSDDACGTTESQAVAALEYGNHYLILSGVNGDTGPVTMHFLRTPLGNGPPVVLPQGAGVVTGTTAGIDSTRTCDTSGPKNSYWWTSCPTDLGGDLHASTCQGADWDTYLMLQVPQTDEIDCADDDQACGMLSTVNATVPPGAGLYVLTIAGGLLRSFGDYTLTYTRP
jgi:hypothetical protein